MKRAVMGVVAATGAMWMGAVPAGAADRSSGSGADTIRIVDSPRVLSSTSTAVALSYRCTSKAADVRIGVRVTGSVIHSNRWARFGYPDTVAECDGRRHTVVVEAALHPRADQAVAFGARERVTVGVDLISYSAATDQHVGDSAILAAARREGVQLKPARH